MRVVKQARALATTSLSVAAGFILLLTPGMAKADTYPFFKVTGGDVFTGGGFVGSCATYYQEPGSYSDSTKYKGGILSFVNPANYKQGSGSQLGAFALGLMDSASATNHGFYSGLAVSGSNNSISFANTSVNLVGNWGGFYDGVLGQQAHCIPDYYGKLGGLNATSLGGTLSSGLGAGVYSTTSNLRINNGASFASGASTTIFVQGNLQIDTNITYSLGTDTAATKLAFVVKGNIYVNPSVATLNGLYIAQPDASSAAQYNSTGEIYTCAVNYAQPVDNYDLWNTCKISLNANGADIANLTFNGAVIAKKINLLRMAGDVANATAGETFNFTPEMLLGGYFFGATSTPTVTIDSIVSLPPIF